MSHYILSTPDELPIDDTDNQTIWQKTMEQDKDSKMYFKTLHSTFLKLPPKNKCVGILDDTAPEDSSSQILQNTLLSNNLKENARNLQAKRDKSDGHRKSENNNNHQIHFPNQPTKENKGIFRNP